ncbi:MAG: DEAD/DEAH box helicase [Rhodobacteraceae bacterium]|nr:DEAD/DEAH box helicase [Paracoccaceae bacterium]
MKFSELEIAPALASAIAASGYTDMTPIQEATIDKAIQGRDILGIARTGTGKTAAFLIPAINALQYGTTKARMPRALVLIPTRELALQVYEYFDRLTKEINQTSVLLVGGTRYQEQESNLQRGVDIIIATPGRMIDHLERQNVMLHGIRILVLDEADRMLEEGFMPQVEKIVQFTPFTRQSMLFSATMDPEIERLGRTFLHNPLVVEVSPRATVSAKIEQCAYIVGAKNLAEAFDHKRATLRHVLKKHDSEITNAIIFCNRKIHVDIVQKSLKFHKFNCEAIHGDMNQPLRTSVMERFRSGGFKLLAASDVASRGLDIPRVSHVINFDVPVNPEDYIHRIGRTGRAGNKGVSITICAKSELQALGAVEKLIDSELERHTWELPPAEIKRLDKRRQALKRRPRHKSARPGHHKKRPYPKRRRRAKRASGGQHQSRQG